MDIQELEAIYNLLLPLFSGLSRVEAAMHRELELSVPQVSLLEKYISELKDFKPVQHIIGNVHFMELELIVNRDVLIPRPETEELCDLLIRENNHRKGLVIADICSGSGCIALALKKHLDASVMGIEVSKEAISVAELNAKKNNVDVRFFLSNILTDKLPGKFDIIVSNPPYIPSAEICAMDRNVIDHEPHLALFPEGNDPLVFYKRIAELSMDCLKNNGKIYFEIHSLLARETEEALHAYGFSRIETICDLSGKSRFIKCFK